MKIKKINVRMILLLFLVFSSINVYGAEETEEPFYKSESIFEAVEDRPANHASSIAQMPNGDLLVSWFGGSREGMPDVGIWTSRRPAGSDVWTAPVEIVDDPQNAEGNSVLFVDSGNRVWLFYVVKHDERWDAWEKSYIFVRTSDDNGNTWSAERQVTSEYGSMIRGNVTGLPDGGMLIPIYTEFPKQTLIWISGDGFMTWDEYKIPITDPGNYQADVESLGGGRMISFARHDGVPGKTWVSVSDDWGRTWKEPRKTKFKNPDSGVSLLALDDKTLVVVYNDNAWTRTPLNVAMSEDGGKTWPYEKTLESSSAEFSYPYLVKSADGRIHLTYTADGRKTIRHSEFNTAWLKEGK